METKQLSIDHIPCVLYGAPSERICLYVHGKSGCKEDAEHLAHLICEKNWQVLALDLPGHGERLNEMERFVPWEVLPELQAVYCHLHERYEYMVLCANSIGAYFSLLAFKEARFEKVLLVSPVLDMRRLIQRMMDWASLTPAELEAEKKISTAFGETLSWEYFRYAETHPIRHIPGPAAILYAEQDHLVERQTVDAFVQRFNAKLMVMENGEHWFHTEEQLRVMDNWIRNELL